MKKANPFGLGFLAKHSSEESRGRLFEPANAFPSTKETAHFGVTGAGAQQEASVGTKPLSLIWLSYTTFQCPFNNRYTITSGVFSSSLALH